MQLNKETHLTLNFKKVAFDFDGTLTRSDVQRYARLLVKLGHEVHIVTSRHENMDLFDGNHQDLYEVALRLGISNDNIHFLNCTDKAKFFINNKGFEFHLDDDWFVVDAINEYDNNVVGICVLSDSWVLRCDEIIKYDVLVNTDKETIRKYVNTLLEKYRGEKEYVELLNDIKNDLSKNLKENGKI